VGDKLTTHDFNTGTRGFAAAEDPTMAVCVLPGTELAFSDKVTCGHSRLTDFLGWRTKTFAPTAIFRQIHKDEPYRHHDALEFPDGQTVLLTALHVDQTATVLQLPAPPKSASEMEAQTRAAYAG